MKFGINPIRKLTGAELSVRIMQIAAILPAIHVFMIAGYPSLITRRSFFSFLFDVGICTLPRLEVLGLAAFYKLTSSEIAFNFAVLVFALAFGLAAKPLLRGNEKRAVVSRCVFAVLILADLIVRFIPLQINTVFGVAPAIIGFVIRLACLVLIILDLMAWKRREPTEAEA